jgi:hypothetical protein
MTCEKLTYKKTNVRGNLCSCIREICTDMLLPFRNSKLILALNALRILFAK